MNHRAGARGDHESWLAHDIYQLASRVLALVAGWQYHDLAGRMRDGIDRAAPAWSHADEKDGWVAAFFQRQSTLGAEERRLCRRDLAGLCAATIDAATDRLQMVHGRVPPRRSKLDQQLTAEWHDLRVFPERAAPLRAALQQEAGARLEAIDAILKDAADDLAMQKEEIQRRSINAQRDVGHKVNAVLRRTERKLFEIEVGIPHGAVSHQDLLWDTRYTQPFRCEDFYVRPDTSWMAVATDFSPREVQLKDFLADAIKLYEALTVRAAAFLRPTAAAAPILARAMPGAAAAASAVALPGLAEVAVLVAPPVIGLALIRYAQIRDRNARSAVYATLDQGANLLVKMAKRYQDQTIEAADNLWWRYCAQAAGFAAYVDRKLASERNDHLRTRQHYQQDSQRARAAQNELYFLKDRLAVHRGSSVLR